ncbi:hypothetical protein CH275_10235 [Rhodococcus sp. 06-235-1A]|uniref:hypothetical protein n=1 Tax=Rhodococcus sp. 06-235-1A TaxID=2022508 RepID=UPI000B9BFA9A|nr:hypothetical protein [Rhodococcus sp. 06-235-1A]OZD06578.1 hypothetical protein CH275_10235 [Rhodococcus sp. 06-235-1A]
MPAHRGIENKIRYVRDVTFGGDASRVRTGSGTGDLRNSRPGSYVPMITPASLTLPGTSDDNPIVR